MFLFLFAIVFFSSLCVKVFMCFTSCHVFVHPLCFLLVVTTPTLAHSTLRAVRLPDSPPESCLLSPVLKIVTPSLSYTAEQLSVWVVKCLPRLSTPAII